MAKKRIGYDNLYCTRCGEAIEKGTVACPNCGAPYDEEKRWAGVPSLGAAGIGFSSHASDGTFRKHKTRYGLGVLVFLLIVSVIIFLAMLLSGDIDLSAGGLVIFGAVMAVLWTFWILWYVIDNRKVKDWDGVVTRKEQETTRYVRKDEDGYRHTQEQTAYRVWFRTDGGKTKKLVQYDKPAWYNYLNEGERVRYHGGKNYYEKYDKSREETLPCAGCGSRRDAREDYCGRCGCRMLKADSPVAAAEAVRMAPHYCAACGAPLGQGAKFCENCGTKIG